MTADGVRRDVVVAGASAGGVAALSRMVAPLAADFPGAVLAVLHVSATSVLPQILDRASALPASPAKDGEPLERGRIYVAPPGHHVVLERERIRLTRGPRENGHRPAVDPLMRSAAAALGQRVIGVVLSGTRDDGSAGLARVKASGGLTIVQDPDEALYPAMPHNAMHSVEVDHVLPAGEIAAVLTAAARGEQAPQPVSSAAGRNLGDALAGGTFSCPECGGVPEPEPHDGPPRVRCRVGHTYTEQGLLAEQSPRVESALWAAVRSLEERAELLRRMAARAAGRDQHGLVARSRRQADELDSHAASIRQVVLDARLDASEPPPAATAASQ